MVDKISAAELRAGIAALMKSAGFNDVYFRAELIVEAVHDAIKTATPDGPASEKTLIDWECFDQLTCSSLFAAKIVFVEDLVLQTRSDILGIGGIGKKGLAQVEHYLARNGMSLMPEPARKRQRASTTLEALYADGAWSVN